MRKRISRNHYQYKRHRRKPPQTAIYAKVELLVEGILESKVNAKEEVNKVNAKEEVSKVNAKEDFTTIALSY